MDKPELMAKFFVQEEKVAPPEEGTTFVETSCVASYWQLLNLNETTWTATVPPLLYSCVYQNVQSSVGSTLIEL